MYDSICKIIPYNDKANKATTLSEYGITNAYTKTEVDNLVKVVNELKENGGIEVTEFEFAKKNIPEIDEIIAKLEQLKMNL